MSRRKKDPLRELTEPERQELARLSRSQAAPAAEVIRAKILLAVAAGDDYQDAARSVGRRSGDAVSHLVARFNAEGLAALTPRHGGGRRPTYGPQDAGADRGRGPARRRRPRPTAPPPGRSRPCNGRSARPPTACRRSRPTPSGSSSASPGPATSAPAPGAPPARPCGAARPGRRSSPTRTPSPKKVDRGRPTARARRWGWRSGAPTRPGPTRRSRTPASRGGPRASRPGSRTSTSATARPRSLTLFHPADGHVRVEGRDGLPQRGPAPLAEARAGRDPGRDARARRPSPPTGWRAAWERWQEGLTIKPTLPAELPPLRMLLVLDNLAGHKTPGVRLLAVRARDHAAVHAGGRVVAEHGREPAADPQAAGAGRPVPDRHGPDHRLVRGGGAALGRGPDAVRVGRQAGGPPAAATRASPPPRRLGGLLPRPGPDGMPTYGHTQAK